MKAWDTEVTVVPPNLYPPRAVRAYADDRTPAGLFVHRSPWDKREWRITYAHEGGSTLAMERFLTRTDALDAAAMLAGPDWTHIEVKGWSGIGSKAKVDQADPVYRACEAKAQEVHQAYPLGPVPHFAHHMRKKKVAQGG